MTWDACIGGTAGLVLACVVLATGSALAADPLTSIRITVRATPTARAQVTTLRCHPAAGTVPDPVAACRRLLAAGRAAFAPTPPGTACSQIYGGPQQALVTGRLDGRPVWARFSRRDGCEVARWSRVGFLLAG